MKNKEAERQYKKIMKNNPPTIKKASTFISFLIVISVVAQIALIVLKCTAIKTMPIPVMLLPLIIFIVVFIVVLVVLMSFMSKSGIINRNAIKKEEKKKIISWKCSLFLSKTNILNVVKIKCEGRTASYLMRYLYEENNR